MAQKDYIDAFRSLLEDLRQITIMAMAETGIKQESDLSKSVKYVLTKDGIKMQVLPYYPWVSSGHLAKRRAFAHKVPIQVLIEWIKKKHLVPRHKKSGRFMTTNQFAFAIQESIYKKGINGKIKSKGKNYEELVVNNVADYSAIKLADVLAVQIADELQAMFAPVSNT